MTGIGVESHATRYAGPIDGDAANAVDLELIRESQAFIAGWTDDRVRIAASTWGVTARDEVAMMWLLSDEGWPVVLGSRNEDEWIGAAFNRVHGLLAVPGACDGLIDGLMKADLRDLVERFAPFVRKFSLTVQMEKSRGVHAAVEFDHPLEERRGSDGRTIDLGATHESSVWALMSVCRAVRVELVKMHRERIMRSKGRMEIRKAQRERWRTVMPQWGQWEHVVTGTGERGGEIERENYLQLPMWQQTVSQTVLTAPTPLAVRKR